jgi:hypothetical protein
MDNNRHVLESFNEFLQYKGMSLNEKEGSPLDLAGSKELVNLIMEYNAKLATDLYKDSEGLKGEYLRAAANSLSKKDYAKAGVYSIIGTVVTQLITKESFEILKTLIPSITDADYKNYETSKGRKSNGEKILANLEKMNEEDAKKLAPDAIKKIDKTKIGNYLASAIKTPFIWGGLLSKAEQDKSYETFLAEASKKGYDTKEGLAKVIKDEYKDQKGDDRSHMQSPGISAYLDKTEAKVVKEGTPAPKEFKTAIVEEADEDEVFKPNMFGANGEADYMEGTYTKMLDNLGAIFQRILTGEVTTIKSITIHTSADRYRNTGSAEKLSWSQLSLLRSQSMASLVVGMASKSGLPESVVSKINSMITLDFKGGNGDGSSGPNPPAPIKFGYYVADGGKAVWKDGKDRNVMTVLISDDDGIPSGEPKEVKGSPESDKNEYNKFRYNNIEIVYEALPTKPNEPLPPSAEKLVDLSYPIKVRIPARYRKKTIKIPLPYIKLGVKAKAGGGASTSKTACPNFASGGGGGSIKTKFGIGIRPVTIAKWESDLTK